MADITVPSARGIGSALQNYGYGALAGILFRAISSFTGSGILGSAVAAGVSGAVIKGPAGDAIPAILGFQAGQGIGLGGLLGGAQETIDEFL